jgi:transposase
MERPMSQAFDASRSLTALKQDSTIIVVMEMSQSKWLVASIVPGVKRQPLKKLDADEESLFKLLHRWRKEADQAGHPIKRVVVAYEAGRDGFWLARWLQSRGVEAYVIHPTSIAVSREHRRAKTDRLDTELLLRAFLGWLRGEKRHCSMVAIPTAEEEDAKRPNRERDNLVIEQTRIVNQVKAVLIRFGIRSFRPKLRKAEEQLGDLRTAEGSPLPENTRAELCRHIVRLRMVREQIRAVEKERLQKLKAEHARTRRSVLSRESSVSAWRPRTCWSTRSSFVSSVTAGPSLATPALRVPQTRAANVGVRRASRAPAALASVPA